MSYFPAGSLSVSLWEDYDPAEHDVLKRRLRDVLRRAFGDKAPSVKLETVELDGAGMSTGPCKAQVFTVRGGAAALAACLDWLADWLIEHEPGESRAEFTLVNAHGVEWLRVAGEPMTVRASMAGVRDALNADGEVAA